jgi:predicted phage baseplate assembly protein
VQGARLPTGQENVSAVYRTGIGKAGNVSAGQISLLATRPLGVKSVINPLPATGGADREGRDQGRQTAPLGTMALDRLVSVQDYADFALTFAGIGKASSRRLSNGRKHILHLTIAGDGDIPIDENSDLFRNLQEALHQFGDPHQPVQVARRELLLLVISARVKVDPDYKWESVEPKVRAALLDAFSFDRLQLGQSVFSSVVISTIQQVDGVSFVDLEVFDSVSEGTGAADLAKLAPTMQLKSYIDLGPARPRPGPGIERSIDPAQLAYLPADMPEALILKEMI